MESGAGRTIAVFLVCGLLAVYCDASATNSTRTLTVVREVSCSAVERELAYPETGGHYANNLSVAIKFSAPDGARVALEFTRFRFEENFDFVRVLDDLDDFDSAEAFTGLEYAVEGFTASRYRASIKKKKKKRISEDSTLYIGITTDYNGTEEGFAVRYRAVGPTWALPDIVEEVNSTSSVQQFHYQAPPGADNSMNFVVKVLAPPGKKVRLSLSGVCLGPGSYVQLLHDLTVSAMIWEPKRRTASDEVFVSRSSAAYVLLTNITDVDSISECTSATTSPPFNTYDLSYLAVGCAAGDCDATAVCAQSLQEPGFTCSCPAGHVFADAKGRCVSKDAIMFNPCESGKHACDRQLEACLHQGAGNYSCEPTTGAILSELTDLKKTINGKMCTLQKPLSTEPAKRSKRAALNAATSRGDRLARKQTTGIEEGVLQQRDDYRKLVALVQICLGLAGATFLFTAFTLILQAIWMRKLLCGKDTGTLHKPGMCSR